MLSSPIDVARNPSIVERLRWVREALFPETEAQRERRRILLCCLPYFLLATFTAFIPILVMTRMTFSTDEFSNTGFTLEHWHTLLTDTTYHWVAFNTLWFSAAATIFSVIIAVAISQALAKYDLPFEQALVAMVSFPIALPGIVVGFMIIVMFGRQGLLTNLAAWFTGQATADLALHLAVSGLFLGYVFSLIPRATMVMRGAFAEINTDAEEAARALGASPMLTFYYVTLPQVWPGVMAAVILTFRAALAIFGTVLVLAALHVATLQIYLEISIGFDTQMAAAIGLVYFLFIVMFTYAGLQFIDRGELTI